MSVLQEEMDSSYMSADLSMPGRWTLTVNAVILLREEIVSANLATAGDEPKHLASILADTRDGLEVVTSSNGDCSLEWGLLGSRHGFLPEELGSNQFSIKFISYH